MRRRLSPVTVGCGVVALSLAALAVFYTVPRPEGAQPPSGASSPALEMRRTTVESTTGLAAAAAEISGEIVRTGPEVGVVANASSPAAATAAASAMPTADAVDAASADAAGLPDERRRALLVAAHNQILREAADERVFTRRQLSENARAAIRQLNATFAESTRAAVQRADGSALSSGRGAVSLEAEQLRRAALDGVLGPEEARAFETAERLAARALVPRYRRQWSRELHEGGAATAKEPAPAPAPEPPDD